MMITPVESPDIPIIVVQDLLRYTGTVGRLRYACEKTARNFRSIASFADLPDQIRSHGLAVTDV
jgi:hypothetical protein